VAVNDGRKCRPPHAPPLRGPVFSSTFLLSLFLLRASVRFPETVARLLSFLPLSLSFSILLCFSEDIGWISAFRKLILRFRRFLQRLGGIAPQEASRPTSGRGAERDAVEYLKLPPIISRLIT